MLDMVINALGGKEGLAKQIAPLLLNLGTHMEETKSRFALDRYYYVIGAEIQNNNPVLYLKYMVEKDGNRGVVTKENKPQIFYGTDIIKNIAGSDKSTSMMLMPLNGLLNKSLTNIATNFIIAKESDAENKDYAYVIEHEIINGVSEPFMTAKADPYHTEIVCGDKLYKEQIVGILLGFEPSEIKNL